MSLGLDRFKVAYTEAKMTYSQIIALIFNILTIILSIMFFHFIVYALIGIFTHKKFPKAKKFHKYGVVISAHNEEKVIGNLIESIHKADYPADLLQIFVVAHNCTDNTASICRELGATVYEYENIDERTKGYALKHLFDKINEDYGTQNYEGFFVFDADNVLSKDYFIKMNDAFEANGCKNVITSFRNSKNFGTNLMSGLYGVFFMFECAYMHRGRAACGCSTRISGTGFLITSDIVKDGWKYVTLTEDTECTADALLCGKKVIYCDEAIFYDEQPTTFKIMLRQRLRWAKGTLIVCKTKGAQLFGSLFSKEGGDSKTPKRDKFSRYDLFSQLPVGLIALILGVLGFVLRLTGVFFAQDKSAFLTFYGLFFAITTLLAYLFFVFSAALLFVLENKRIKNVGVGRRIAICLVWPFFYALACIFVTVAAFKKVEWKSIPHTDSTKIESLDDKKEGASLKSAACELYHVENEVQRRGNEEIASTASKEEKEINRRNS